MKMKAWQIFTVLFVLPLIIDLIFPLGFEGNENQSLIRKLEPMFYLSPVLIILYISWLLGVGIGLNKSVNRDLRPNNGFFIFSVIIVPLYTILFMILIYRMTIDQNTGWIPFIIPLHFLAMFCQLYIIYFLSKNLLMAERNRQSKFSDILKPYILFLIFPIGIWFIQPRINRLNQNNNT
jgi:hypothetical protein